MTEERETLIRYRIECAVDTLSEAERLVELELWRGAVNRLYYAAFYAVSALLLANDLHSRKHSGVRSLFMQHFGKTGAFEQELIRNFNWLFDSRLKSDYSDLYAVNADLVRGAIEPTRAFITRAQELIEEKL